MLFMDLIIFRAIHSLANQLDILDWFAIFLAKYLPYILVLVLIIFILREKSWKNKLFLVAFTGLVAVLSRGLLTEIIRFIYDRPRPFEMLGFTPLIPNGDPSFPSGHAALFFALALAVFKFDRVWGKWFLAAAFLVSLARIFVGVHYPSDILGGFAIALVSFSVIERLIKKPLWEK